MTTRLGDARQEAIVASEALDADQIAQTYADDGVREDITNATITHGRDDARRSLGNLLGAFTNAMVEHPVAFAASDACAADASRRGVLT